MVTLVLRKIEGRLAFVPPQATNERQALKRLLDLCENRHGGFVSLSFAVPYKKRTSGRHSQNSAIHGFASCIADYTGEELERIKFYCKRRAMRRGYQVKKDELGNIVMSKLDGEPMPESSGRVNTVEAGYLIEELQQLAGELGVILPKMRGEEQD